MLIHIRNIPNLYDNVIETINLFPAKLSYLNFHPLEVVSRYRDTQLQVGENYSYMCLTNNSDLIR